MALPDLNSEGQPAVALTDEQKYQFDIRGWMLVPGVLGSDECAEMRDFAYRLRREPESIPFAERSSIGGPLIRLVDHPVVVGFMNTFVADPHLSTPDGYGFRLENSFLSIRRAGDTNFRPHGGGGAFNTPHNSHVYCARRGAVYSGLTRAVWELNPVGHGEGGTMFLTGSHKAAFSPPESLLEERSPLWDNYECPAGSVLFFTEAITHTGARWTNPAVDRVPIFNCYNTIGCRWHQWEPHPEALEAMNPMRRSLFRPVCCQDNAVRAT